MLHYFVPMQEYLTFQLGSTNTGSGEKSCGLKRLGEGPMGEGRGANIFLGGQTPKDNIIKGKNIEKLLKVVKLYKSKNFTYTFLSVQKTFSLYFFIKIIFIYKKVYAFSMYYRRDAR